MACDLRRIVLGATIGIETIALIHSALWLVTLRMRTELKVSLAGCINRKRLGVRCIMQCISRAVDGAETP